VMEVWRILYNMEVRGLYSSQNIARMRDMRDGVWGACSSHWADTFIKSLVRKAVGKRPLRRCKYI
jgi:hypothetical protein